LTSPIKNKEHVQDFVYVHIIIVYAYVSDSRPLALSFSTQIIFDLTFPFFFLLLQYPPVSRDTQ